VEVESWELDVALFDLADALSLDLAEWHYWYASFYWMVGSYDSEGRPGPFSQPFHLTKIGYRRVCAFGDSITVGKHYPNGYLNLLETKLRQGWDNLTTTNQAVDGTKSEWGAEKINQILDLTCPQYILILFGANDTVDSGSCDIPHDCDVDGNLRIMIEAARAKGSIPLISTVLPMNPEGDFANEQDQVDLHNETIFQMAADIGAPVVDLNSMFWAYPGDMSELYGYNGEDWGHPNLLGYQIMADGFYQAVLAHQP